MSTSTSSGSSSTRGTPGISPRASPPRTNTIGYGTLTVRARTLRPGTAISRTISSSSTWCIVPARSGDGAGALEGRAPEDVALGHGDLVQAEPPQHLEQDDQAGEDRRRPVGVQPDHLAAIGEGHG